MNTHPQITVIKNLISLLEQIPIDIYTKKTPILINGTIGEHVRHSIEFYQCCLQSIQNETLNYSLRKRDHELEISTEKGLRESNKILNRVKAALAAEDKAIILYTASTKVADSYKEVASSFSRELVYCMDHCIHHQFIIRTALIALDHEHILPENFGVAFSTLEYRAQCVS